MFQPAIHEFSPELKVIPDESAKVPANKSVQSTKTGITFIDLSNQKLELPKKVNKFIWIIQSLFKEPSRTIDEDRVFDKIKGQVRTVRENLIQIQRDINSTKEQIKNYSTGVTQGDTKMKNELIQSLAIRRREWRGAKNKLDNLLSAVKKTNFVNFHADIIEDLHKLENSIDFQFKDLSHMGEDLNKLKNIESSLTRILRQRFIENELSIMIGDSRGSLTPHLQNLVYMANELEELDKKHGSDDLIRQRLTRDKNEIIKLITKCVIEEREIGDVIHNVPHSAIRILILDADRRLSKGRNGSDNLNNLKREFRKITYLSEVSKKMADAEHVDEPTNFEDHKILTNALTIRFKELSVLEAKATVANDAKLLKQIHDYKTEILKDPEWQLCNEKANRELSK